jgi:hypothetical protein
MEVMGVQRECEEERRKEHEEGRERATNVNKTKRGGSWNVCYNFIY